jgi:hypothetical protein
MRRDLRVVAMVAVWAVCGAGAAWGETKNPDPARYLFEEAVKPGMKGYGLTCMHGGKIEKFDVEVIDVMRNYAPGSNAILVKCSGLNLEHTGVIAGMSGSPVFVDGKMIGAIAFDWPLGKDPVAGVQPIRQMLAIPSDQGKGERGEGKAFGAAKNVGTYSGTWRGTTGLAGLGKKVPGYGPIIDSLAAKGAGRAAAWDAGGAKGPTLRPIASPVMVSGMSKKSMDILRGAWGDTQLVPVASGSAGATASTGGLGGAADIKAGEIKLEPGSSLAIPLVTGDMDLAAIGTVTEVRGDKVYAFGHAMLAEGSSSLPISTGYIYTIMSNLQQSFKLGASFEPQGSLVTDEQNGVVGLVGEKPRTIPVRLRVLSGDGTVDRTYKYEMAQHARLTPAILGAILTETLTAQRALPKQFTASVAGNVKFENTTLKLDLMGTSSGFEILEAMLPVALLSDNPFENLKIEGIDLEAKVEPIDRSLEIKSVSAAKLTVAPGDDVTTIVEVVPYHQAARKMTIAIKIPRGTPDGDYELCVGGADMMLMQEAADFPHRFEPENIDSLVDAVNGVLAYKKDKIYARVVLDVAGAAQKGREFTHIPPSKVALYASEKLTGTRPVKNAVMTEVDAGGVVDGGQVLHITVDKDADKRFFAAKAAAGGSMGLPDKKRSGADNGGDQQRPPEKGADPFDGE